jgi:hypothetical protein
MNLELMILGIMSGVAIGLLYVVAYGAALHWLG